MRKTNLTQSLWTQMLMSILVMGFLSSMPTFAEEPCAVADAVYFNATIPASCSTSA